MTDIKEAQGLEVIGKVSVTFDEGDEGAAIELVDLHCLLDEGDTEICRFSDATAVIDQLRERVAELEAKWRTEHDTANAHIMAHDAVRAELAALKSAPVVMPDDKAIEQVMADVCEENKEFEIGIPYYALCVHEFKEVLARLNRSKT